MKSEKKKKKPTNKTKERKKREKDIISRIKNERFWEHIGITLIRDKLREAHLK